MGRRRIGRELAFDLVHTEECVFLFKVVGVFLLLGQAFSFSLSKYKLKKKRKYERQSDEQESEE